MTDTDIVERLRTFADDLKASRARADDTPLVLEAADEIERLRCEAAARMSDHVTVTPDHSDHD